MTRKTGNDKMRASLRETIPPLTTEQKQTAASWAKRNGEARDVEWVEVARMLVADLLPARGSR